MKSVACTAPGLPDAEVATLIRRAFERAEYTVDHVRSGVLPAAVGTDRSVLATLVRLFFLNAPVEPDAMKQAFEPLELAELERLNVLTCDSDGVRGAFQVVPDSDMLLASDWDNDTSPEHVMSPAKSSRRLAALTIRRPVQSALDLGTGCGYQALLAARHAEHVIATDTNQRALAFAAFNARLNGTTNVELIQSNWFDALDGLAFDLIACNPPYVIGPDLAALFRDDASGSLSETLVRSAPSYLRDGGVAHVITGWTHAAGQHWAEPLQQWVKDSGCDAWFFRERSLDPPTHAAVWNAGLAGEPRRYAETIERWTRFLVARAIELVADGAVVVRKRTGRSSLNFDGLPPDDLPHDAADDLARRIDMVALLDAMREEAFLEARLELVAEHRLEQVLRHAVDDAGFATERCTLVLEAGLGSTLPCNPAFVQLLAALDGKRTVAEILHGSTQRFRAGAVASLKYALRHGFLRFAD